MNRNELIKAVENHKEGDCLHVIPSEDEDTHLENQFCPCEPMKLSNVEIWVHNSFDGREALIVANEILKD